MKSVTLSLSITILIAASTRSIAQNVAINATGSSGDASAMLDVRSTTSGFLMPRMTTAEQNTISLPATGLTIFNTTLNTIMLNTGTALAPVWTALNAGTIDTSSIANFSTKVRSLITASAPITFSNGQVGITQSGTSTDGYLSSTDWNTFNNKADATTSWSTLGNSVASMQKIGTITNFDFPVYTNNTEKMRLTTAGRLGIGVSGPTAMLHLKAGTTSANTAPLKFNSGSLMTTAEAGAVEFLTDKYYGTITTGAARKEFTLNDIALTSGRVPFTTTSGRLTDLSTFTYASNRLNPKYLTLAAGTAAAGTAPLVMTAGVNLTTPVAGAVEFDGSHFYGTVGSTRYQLDQQTNSAWSTTGNSGTSYASNFLGTTDNQSLRFRTNNSESMIIDSTGSVGIGTTAFDPYVREKFLVDAGTTPYNGSYNARTPINGVGFTNGYLQIQVQNRNWGKFASSDLVAASDGSQGGTMPYNTDVHYVDLGINSSNYDNNNSNILNHPYTSYLYATSPGNFFIGNGYSGKDIVFFTNSGPTNTNNTADGSERMRLSTSGNLGIGDFSSGTAPAYLLTVKGTVAPFSSNGGGSGDLGSSTNRWGTVYAQNALNTSSDRRLKTNIINLGYGLKEVMALQPVTYNWKTTPDIDKKLGLIAQDVRKVVPEVVKGDESKETLSIAYADLIPVLINAIKEQQQQIELLKKEVELLKVKK